MSEVNGVINRFYAISYLLATSLIFIIASKIIILKQVRNMKKLTQEEFIEKARLIHGDKYNYSKAIYKNYREKLCIICPKHGEFWQAAQHHLCNHGCPKCADNQKKSCQEFVEKAKNIHGNKYDYSKIEYRGNKIKVCIICPEHGEFWQKPQDHLRGKGCGKCIGRNLTTKEWIEKAKIIHGNKYDYSRTKYINAKSKICIICPEHGEFWQRPQDHLRGHGCPYCNKSILETEIESLLTRNNILFEKQKTFDWLVNKINMRLDFYLPNSNIAIECQGEQHYKPVKHFGGLNAYEKTIKRDRKKEELCKKNGINLLYFTHYKNITKTNNIYNNKESLLTKLIL